MAAFGLIPESPLCDNDGVKRNLLSKIAWPVLVGVTLLACQSVPITGRHQLLLISEQQEADLGDESYKKVLEKSKLSGDLPAAEMVKRVGRRIAAASDRPDFQWEFNLIEDQTPNAFCLPGGKVAVHTGILKYTRDENGLAVVMGHEVAHALAHHGAERMSTAILARIAATGAAIALGGGDPQTEQAVERAFGIGSEVGVLLPFSRKHESEADKIGLHLMAKAGYDPREAASFWKRMSEAGKDTPPEFLSTHPSDATRIREIEKWLPDVMPIYEKQRASRPGP